MVLSEIGVATRRSNARFKEAIRVDIRGIFGNRAISASVW